MNKIQFIKPTLSCLIVLLCTFFLPSGKLYSTTISLDKPSETMPPCFGTADAGDLAFVGDTILCDGQSSPIFFADYSAADEVEPVLGDTRYFWLLTKDDITEFDIVTIIEDIEDQPNNGQFPNIPRGDFKVHGISVEGDLNVIYNYDNVQEIMDAVTAGNICADIDPSEAISISNLECPMTVSLPCSCRYNPANPNQNGNATNNNNGQFNETISVNAPSGQTWRVFSVDGFYQASSLFPPLHPTPFVTGLNGTLLQETVLGNGMSAYSLEGIHTAGIGYAVKARNNLGVERTMPRSTCYYPDLELDGWSYTKVYCENSGVVTITGRDKNGGIGIGGFSLYSGNNLIQTSFGTAYTFEPGILPTGNYRLEFIFDGQAPGQNDRGNPGCQQVIEESFSVINTPVSMACNNNIGISLGVDCSAEIEPDFILEGSYGCYDDYSMAIFQNNSMIPTSPVVTGNYVGQTLMVKVTHLPSGNRCWGAINISDKIKPEIDCGGPYYLDCTDDSSLIPLPTATDGCDPNPLILLVSESSHLDACGTTIISKTYKARDYRKNTSAPCVQEIHISQADLVFPEDITWTCEQYASFPNVVLPTKLHECLKDPLLDGEDDIIGVNAFDNASDGEDFDVPLLPDFDDNIDNPLTDPNPNSSSFLTIGTPSSETDSYDGNGKPLVCNLSVNYNTPFQFLINSAPHIPDTFKIPNYPLLSTDGLPLRGLEDADILAITGSGVPNLLDSDCPVHVTYSDKKLQACPGQGKDRTFKILRTWTVLNHCTGTVTTEVQTIKVVDKVAPTIVFDDNFNTELVADQFEDFITSECSSSGLLDIPSVFDNCSGITELRVFSAAGEGISVYDISGRLVGFKIAPPYLPKGYHDVTYQATDGCGNISSEIVKIRVIDGIPPIPICRELTQISLTSDDIMTSIDASNFDVGSYDNCGEVYFKIRRLDTNCPGKTEDRTKFNDEISFCCEDIGDTTKVILRVYDIDPGPGIKGLGYKRSRSNDCEVEVLVSDFVKPQCVPPADVWTYCDVVPDNLDLSDVAVLQTNFGFANAVDNCSASIAEKTPVISLDMCGSGTITRSFVANDIHGNRSSGNCMQTVMIQPVISNKIHFPGDYQIDCMMPMADTMTYEELGCDLLAKNVEDLDFFGTPDGSCKKILRTYRVINWCTYNGWSDPVQLPRLDLNSDGDFGDGYSIISDGTDLYINNISAGNFLEKSIGFVEYTQHVKVYDGVAPVLTSPLKTEFCGGEKDENPCTGYVSILPLIEELCTPDYISISWELDLYADGNFEYVGNDSLTGRYELGHHRAKFNVSDDCGNRSEIIFEFDIIDCKAPTPVCHQGLAVDLMANGMVPIWASDFNASSFDYCNPIKFRINKVEDLTGDGFITSDDYVLDPPLTDSVQFTCSDKGTIRTIQFWVGEESDDDVNNWDFCTTYIDIQDNFNNCSLPNTKVRLDGNIKMENDKSVGNVMVDISGGITMSMMTPDDGNYNFNDVEIGSDFTITPMRDDDHTLGVSTIDLIMIQRHLLKVELLDSPYKIIAADVNKNNSLSTLDLVSIRKIVLRTTERFPNNTAWRFIPKSFIFPNSDNPWETYFPELMSYNNVSQNMRNSDFIAIKIGDVNLDVDPNHLLNVNDRHFGEKINLKASNSTFRIGERVKVDFSAEELGEIIGMQFTLNFDTDFFKFKEVIGGKFSAECFSFSHADIGRITSSFDSRQSVETEEKCFTLVFEAKQSGVVSEVISISSDLTPIEAYGFDFELMELDLKFEKMPLSGFYVKPAFPNPFSEVSKVTFNLAEPALVKFLIFSGEGEVLKAENREFPAGENFLEIKSEDFNSEGIYFYQLKTGEQSVTDKIVHFKSRQ